MNTSLKQAYRQEMALAKKYYRQQDYDLTFYHLERAHILGQCYVIPHTRAHWWMLKVGWRCGDAREIRGQILRIAGSLVLSRIWVPLGNTGGADVSPIQPMAIPDDLKALLESR
ncbi:MAG: hypothetical protein CSH49_02625 [Alcanivorax sp.]|jgi:hypothetical protein|nr:DUF3703 domain-containing protein [Ketobacter sp.]MEC8811893.1 DUF3703 domain-containing protein [Pseudomonadota bacterium]TNC90469.1 MAG: hypothetical protein CSH49_02625 [Alcanivorax sp.]|tara:strand:+ start:271 stop:612 length:342 start_codon:yes stop_codon:yes gene_type:complete